MLIVKVGDILTYKNKETFGNWTIGKKYTVKQLDSSMFGIVQVGMESDGVMVLWFDSNTMDQYWEDLSGGNWQPDVKPKPGQMIKCIKEWEFGGQEMLTKDKWYKVVSVGYAADSRDYRVNCNRDYTFFTQKEMNEYFTDAAVKCECGSDSVGHPGHAHYCPKGIV